MSAKIWQATDGTPDTERELTRRNGYVAQLADPIKSLFFSHVKASWRVIILINNIWPTPSIKSEELEKIRARDQASVADLAEVNTAPL